MRLRRWLPTFLGFPLGGWLAVQAVGSIDGALPAAAAGGIAGAAIGAAQWLALRPHGVGRWWPLATSAALAGGSALAARLTGAETDLRSLIFGGLVTGALVGVAQGAALRRGRTAAAAWIATVSLSWALGWLVTTSIGLDVERGYAVFGASGALVFTLLTGLALRRLAGVRDSQVSGARSAAQAVAA